MSNYIYREESGYEENFEAESHSEAIEYAEDRLRNGSWGQDDAGFIGCQVTAYIAELDEDGETEVWDRHVSVDLEPDEPDCDSDAGEHDWRPNPDDGCTENPGVWSLGGTTISSVDFCLHCGLRRKQITRGSQRNPGEADTTEYEPADDDLIEKLREHYL